MPAVDDLGRPSIAPSIKAQIDQAFDGLEGRGAVLIIADETGTRAHLAAKLNDHWKVAAGAGWTWADKKPSGFVTIAATW